GVAVEVDGLGGAGAEIGVAVEAGSPVGVGVRRGEGAGEPLLEQGFVVADRERNGGGVLPAGLAVLGVLQGDGGLGGPVGACLFVVDVAVGRHGSVVLEGRGQVDVGGVGDVEAEGLGGDLLEGHAVGACDEFGARSRVVRRDVQGVVALAVGGGLACHD